MDAPENAAPATSAEPVAAGDEFERRPVPAAARKGPRWFWGMYAGEHAAGTEFMIGPLFLAAGVSAVDLFAGLLLGNLLAVLCWRFLCAEIATRSRLTLYYQLERICGRRLVVLYNLANGVLFCFLAGAMITVSATAVGIPFDMPMPGLDTWMPTGAAWVAVVVGVGAVISVVAARGYAAVSRFANVAAPWMVVVFLACGLVALPRLGVQSPADFWHVASTEIWPGGAPLPGQTHFGFWHVVFFAWFCNAAMHIGMADLSVLRYARSPRAGWASAAGMFIGHYMAWIAAALLYAVQLRTPAAQAQLANGVAPAVLPGPMAYDALGLVGVLCVLVAGWTTANPTIYRAGLAFQAVAPRSSRTAVTLLAGGLATVAGLFPAFAMQLLGFVGIYGTILAPVGAVIVVDRLLARRLSLQPEWALARGRAVNGAVLVAWLLPVAGAAVAWRAGVFPSFTTLPAWLACGVLYAVVAPRVRRPA